MCTGNVILTSSTHTYPTIGLKISTAIATKGKAIIQLLHTLILITNL